VGALAAVLALACASGARASSIVYVCAPNLCRIDPAHPKKVTRLTRDGKASGPVYGSPSLSTNGRKLTFVKGNRLYVAQGNATHARRVDEPAGSALTWMRPDGRQVLYIRSVNTIISPGTFYPYYSPPVYGIVPFLFVRDVSGGKAQTVARSTTSAGWLRDRALFPDEVAGDGPRPDEICVLAPPGSDELCERPVATDPQQRTLSSPAASPDGRYLAAVAEPFSAEASYKQAFVGAIALFNPATGELLRDLTTAHADGDPVFSPDGKQVAFTRNGGLYVVAVAGGKGQAPAARGPGSDVGRALAGPLAALVLVATAPAATAQQPLTGWGQTGKAPNQLQKLGGIAADARGYVYAADYTGGGVLKYTATGEYVRTIGRRPSNFRDPPRNDQILRPEGVAVGPDGTLYASDQQQRRVQHYTPEGGFVGSFGSQGMGGGQFEATGALAAAPDGSLYVADWSLSSVQRFAPGGAFVGRVGNGVGGGAGQFSHPFYVAVDCHGTLYVSDVDNDRIQRLGDPGAPPCGDPAHDAAERLVVTATARTPQRFRTTFALAVGVGCDRPCTATVSGTVKLAGRRRALRLPAQSEPLDGTKPSTVRVAPSERDTDRLLAALRRHRRVVATLRIAATDLRGQRRTVTRRVRLR
jgi:hypothetical protein